MAADGIWDILVCCIFDPLPYPAKPRNRSRAARTPCLFADDWYRHSLGGARDSSLPGDWRDLDFCPRKSDTCTQLQGRLELLVAGCVKRASLCYCPSPARSDAI